MADIGTRAEKVTLQDVGQDSRYENGDLWMTMNIEDAIKSGVLKPAGDLKSVSTDEEEEFKRGFIFEKEPEVLTRGHISADKGNTSQGRIAKLEERALFSNYGRLLPTRRKFPAMVRITAYVIAFVTKCRMKAKAKKGENFSWSGSLLGTSSLKFSAFPSNFAETGHMQPWINFSLPGSDQALVNAFSLGLLPVSLAFFMETHASRESSSLTAKPTSKFLNAALIYYFRLGSQEVLHFNSRVVTEKRTVMKDGILLSKSRIIQGMNFLETADMDTLNLDSIGLKTRIPVLDRFSPIAYSISQYIHWNVAHHKGMETCLRMSLEHVHILQGMSLFREINSECIRCKIKRGKFIQASLGPLSDKQLIVAPPFYAVQIDLCGPCRVFVPGFERETRASKVKESKVWIMVAVCLVTSNVNLQVCEKKDTAAMLEAIVRLACECGYPKFISCDKESSILAALKNIDVNLRDLQHRLYQEHGVILEEAAVGGHDQHGKVERTIRSVQDSLEDIGLSKMRIHAMGLQTLCKQIENAYNNLPLGYRYDRSHDNTELLKVLVPNVLRIGRINSRALEGPVRLSCDTKRILHDIQEKFESWFRVWCDVYVPKLLVQKTGFKNDRDLNTDDLVYFRKREGELGNSWTLGRIEQVIRGRDGVIRRVIVAYKNANEEIQRYTERSVRRLIKLYSMEDPDLHEDLSVLQKRIDGLEENLVESVHTASQSQLGIICSVDGGASCKLSSTRKCACCCSLHCKMNLHNFSGTRTYLHEVPDVHAFSLDSDGLDVIGWRAMEDEEETDVGNNLDQILDDGISSLMLSLSLRL